MEWNNKIAALHGLDCTFPFLDRDLLALLMAVPGDVQARDGVPRALVRAAMRGTLPPELCERRWKADFTDAVNRGVAQDMQTIAAALTRDSAVVQRGYVDASRLQPEIDRRAARLSGREATASWDLADLYGLERWLRLFLPAV